MIKIEILGTGCPKCEKLAKNAQLAAENSGVEYELKKVRDINEITAKGVLMTPGLVINGELVSQGRVLNSEQIVNYIK